MPVAHRADVLAVLSLLVSLPEELLHDEVDPPTVELQRLRRVREIRAVHHVLKDLEMEIFCSIHAY